jgi:hypothetical protein
MLLHIDGSKHAWFQDERWYDFIVILDDATSEIYYAQLVEEDSTKTVMAALREVVANQGVFCSLYSDRGSHFFYTPKAGQAVDKDRLTQVGRALRDLGIRMIPAYSPEARGRMECSNGTWQGRLPQELRVAGIRDVERANRFLREHYIAEFNARFTVAAEQRGSAFTAAPRRNLDLIFSIQHERTVSRDNTVWLDNRSYQIEETRWRNTLAGCAVVVHEHLNGDVSIRLGPHEVLRCCAGQSPPPALQRKPAPRVARTKAKEASGFDRVPPSISSSTILSIAATRQGSPPARSARP